MNPWLFPWMGTYKWPLSGDVNQDISPMTRWLSPQVEFNFAGDRQVESEVIAEVASYGKQLGILSEAILEIANDEKGEAVKRLESLVAQINQVKEKQSRSLEQRVRGDLETLKSEDPQAFRKVLEDLG